MFFPHKQPVFPLERGSQIPAVFHSHIQHAKAAHLINIDRTERPDGRPLAQRAANRTVPVFRQQCTRMKKQQNLPRRRLCAGINPAAVCLHNPHARFSRSPCPPPPCSTYERSSPSHSRICCPEPPLYRISRSTLSWRASARTYSAICRRRSIGSLPRTDPEPAIPRGSPDPGSPQKAPEYP